MTRPIHTQFHQIEGLVIGENITLADLKGDASRLRQKIVRRRARNPFASELLPVHGTFCRSRCQLLQVRRIRLQCLQANRLDRNPGIRHCASECSGNVGDRFHEIFRFCFWAWARACSDVEIWSGRYPSLLSERHPILKSI